MSIRPVKGMFHTKPHIEGAGVKAAIPIVTGGHRHVHYHEHHEATHDHDEEDSAHAHDDAPAVHDDVSPNHHDE